MIWYVKEEGLFYKLFHGPYDTKGEAEVKLKKERLGKDKIEFDLFKTDEII